MTTAPKTSDPAHAAVGKVRAGRQFWRRGEPFVWASGAALAFTLALTAALLLIVLVNGMGVFWPHAVAEVRLSDGTRLLGNELQTEANQETGVESVKFRVGNAEDGPDFRWVRKEAIVETTWPAGAFVLDRTERLAYFGFLKALDAPALEVATDAAPAEQLAAALAAAAERRRRDIVPLQTEQQALARQLEREAELPLMKARYRQKQLLAAGQAADSPAVAEVQSRIAELLDHEHELKAASDQLTGELAQREAKLRANVAVFRDAAGREKRIPLVNIVRFACPNSMGLGAKISHYLAKLWELVSADPRESNQDGGVFPAIFGTVLMVFLMAITCFPLGVLAGVYLGKYAKEGPLVRLVRVAVNNLAGIPSIVYGIFGLGFFIYLVGGQLDQWFFPERLAAGKPVFGQGCIFWASLTLGLLTVPVVIVSTEEALRAIPRGVSESSYALGATKFQTLWRVLLPMASPGMMTGFILAMARAAGEVAPLMLTGAIKSAPAPFDAAPPFVRLDQKFMHLGYHILDISCKSPNVEATKPMVYVTTLLLLLIVLTMSSVAIWLRNRMRKRFQSRTI